MTAGWTAEAVAAELLACESDCRDREKFTDEWPELDLATGYRVQALTLAGRIQRGETVTGVKLGLTSEAKQRRMGIDTPLVAWVTDAMALAPGQPVPLDKLIHPRIEPEIVFVMRERLEGPDVTAEQALAAVGAVHAGAEVIDSRYRDFRFTAGDVVADNASSGAYVVSEVSAGPAAIDLAAEGVEVLVDGEVVYTATGADVLGHPARALALAANNLAERSLAIEAGWLVLSGGMSDAVVAAPGSTVTCRFDTLGVIELQCR